MTTFPQHPQFQPQPGYPPQPGYQQPPQQQWGQPPAPPQPGYPPQGAQGWPPQQPQGRPMFGPPPGAGQGFAGMFRGVEQARSTPDSEYVKAGHYWMVINKLKCDVNRKRVPFAAVEMTCIRVFENFANAGHRVGDAVSRVFSQGGAGGDFFLPEVKKFISGTMGIPVENITEAQCDIVFRPDSPLMGTIVEVVATGVTTKADKPFVRVSFRREVTAMEALQTLDPAVVAQFFPNNSLHRMAENEAANGVQPRPATPVHMAPPQQPQGQVAGPGYPHTPGYGPAHPAPSMPAPPAAAAPVMPPQGGQWVQDPTQPNGWRWQV